MPKNYVFEPQKIQQKRSPKLFNIKLNPPPPRSKLFQHQTKPFQFSKLSTNEPLLPPNFRRQQISNAFGERFGCVCKFAEQLKSDLFRIQICGSPLRDD